MQCWRQEERMLEFQRHCLSSERNGHCSTLALPLTEANVLVAFLTLLAWQAVILLAAKTVRTTTKRRDQVLQRIDY